MLRRIITLSVMTLLLFTFTTTVSAEEGRSYVVIDDIGLELVTTANGNIDGDEYVDIIIGCAENREDGPLAGKVYIFLGKNLVNEEVRLSQADVVFTGEGFKFEEGIEVLLTPTLIERDLNGRSLNNTKNVGLQLNGIILP
jgi:hypothetical protein